MDFKLNSYGIHRRRVSVRGFILFLAGVVFLSGIPIVGVALDENVPPEVGTNSRQLTWSADEGSLDLTKSLLVLIGNVKIVQGETAIFADNAQIFLTKNVTADQTLNADSFEKFIANGNVRIELEIGVATSKRAVYLSETKTLTLLGTPAKFVRGDDTITGSTITVDRETGNVAFKNAKAVIFSEGNL